MFKRMPNASQGESFKKLPLVSSSLLVKVTLAAVKDKPGGFNGFIQRELLSCWVKSKWWAGVPCSTRPLRDPRCQRPSHFNTLFPGVALDIDIHLVGGEGRTMEDPQDWPTFHWPHPSARSLENMT